MKSKLENRAINILAITLALSFCSSLAYAQPKPAPLPQGPALDLSIEYYDKAITSEGVQRESRYKETMLRRPGHVWGLRVIPKTSATEHAHHKEEVAHEHKHFNPVLLPRHVALTDNNVKLEYVDHPNKQLINIVATEFENVSFDGSWVNAYFLVDPKLVAAIPLSNKTSTVAGARWHEQEKNGIFQRVLWDEKNMIPLEVETGKRDGSLLKKVSVKIESKTNTDEPWGNVKGYSQKEYSDFLD